MGPNMYEQGLPLRPGQEEHWPAVKERCRRTVMAQLAVVVQPNKNYRLRTYERLVAVGDPSQPATILFTEYVFGARIDGGDL